jgi:hypothetical protein
MSLFVSNFCNATGDVERISSRKQNVIISNALKRVYRRSHVFQFRTRWTSEKRCGKDFLSWRRSRLSTTEGWMQMLGDMETEIASEIKVDKMSLLKFLSWFPWVSGYRGILVSLANDVEAFRSSMLISWTSSLSHCCLSSGHWVQNHNLTLLTASVLHQFTPCLSSTLA